MRHNCVAGDSKGCNSAGMSRWPPQRSGGIQIYLVDKAVAAADGGGGSSSSNIAHVHDVRPSVRILWQLELGALGRLHGSALRLDQVLDRSLHRPVDIVIGRVRGSDRELRVHVLRKGPAIDVMTRACDVNRVQIDTFLELSDMRLT